MKVERQGDNLVITIPIHDPTPSRSGKGMVVASSHGNQATQIIIDAMPVMVGVNAYIRKSANAKP